MTVQVSVVMAVKNERIYIREAIGSILAQQGVSLELVVIDDGSTDETASIVEEIAAGDSRVRLLRNPKAGKVSAFNLGVAEATGDWTCIFAGDDIMPPGSLKERHDAVVDQTDGPALNGMCRLTTMSEDPKLHGQVVPRNPNKATFSGVCYLMNRASVAAMWPIPEHLPNEDTWLELAAQYLGIPYRTSATIGCAWRIHANNSINLLVPYPDFNRKFTIRMVANRLFLDRYGDSVTPEVRTILEARVRCEEARKRGSIWGVLTSGVDPVSALRAASLATPFTYRIRQRAYMLFTGWV